KSIRARHGPRRVGPCLLVLSKKHSGPITTMNASFLAEKFAAALAYEPYVHTGTEDQQRRWRQVHDATQLTAEQGRLLASFRRDLKVLIVSGIWCGDCVQQCPLLQRCAEANRQRI